MSKILGIFGGSHNASASFVEDGEIVCCIEEERLKRVKSGNDFGRVPRLACKAIMEKYQLEIDDFDHIAVCAPFCNDFVKSLNPDPKKLTLINHHTCHCYGAYLTSGFLDKSVLILLIQILLSRMSSHRTSINSEGRKPVQKANLIMLCNCGLAFFNIALRSL